MKVIVLLTARSGKLHRRTVWPHCGGGIVISKPAYPKIELDVPNQKTEDIHLMDVPNIYLNSSEEQMYVSTCPCDIGMLHLNKR